jgi:hypothetical protein
MKIGQSPSTPAARQAGQTPDKSSSAELSSELDSGTPSSQLVKGTVISKTSVGYLIKTDTGVLTANSFIPLDIGSELWFEPLGGSGSDLAPATPQKAMPAIMRLLLPLLSAGGGEMLASANSRADAALVGKGATAVSSEAGNPLNFLADYGVTSKADPVKLLAFMAAINKSGVADASFIDTIASGLDGREHGKHVPKTLEAAASAVKSLFEAHAQLNTQAQVNSQSQLFLFPYFFAGASGWGEWLYSFDKQNDHDENSTSAEYGISFYLTMTRLGEMHLQLTGKGKELRGTFTLPSREAAAHVNANLAQLQPVLEQFYQPVNISCRHDSVDNLQKIKDDLIRGTGSSKDLFTLLDIKA